MTMKLKRGISLLLTFCMTLGLLCTGALAEEADVEPQAGAGETHIATYVNVAPEGLTGDFSVPYSTVKATAADGTEYTVEVVPENLVYFIDQINYDAGTVSKPYEAVHALIPDLLNDKYDQQASDGSWGLVGNANAKSTSGLDQDNKYDTGLYGTANASGNSIQYALPLVAGKYTVTTGHREWWGNARDMEISVQAEAGVSKIDSLKVAGKTSETAKIAFEVSTDQTITLTIKANSGQAPIISWLGVVRDGDAEVPDDNVVESGDCGDQGGNVKWVLTRDGTLTISGTGAMADYSDYNVPWKDYRSADAENKITSIVLKPGITHIGDNAFYFCQGVEGKVVIPEGVESIGYRAFYEAKFMTGIKLPSTLKTIGNSAFNGCRALKELNLPQGLTSIGQYAFSYCRALEKIEIPASVTSVGKNAFENCDGLKYAVLSTAIGSSMFDKGNYVDDLQLTTVSIAHGTASIGYGAFSDCKKLSAIIVDAETLNDLCGAGSSKGVNHLPGAGYPSSPDFTATYYVIGDSVDASVLTELPKASFAVLGAGAIMGVEDTRPSKEGFNFGGWTDSEGNAVTEIAGTVYAKWICVGEHTWNDGVVTSEPTCTAEGVKTFTCSACGETKTEAVEKLAHTEETILGKAAACTETGLTDGVRCSRCGEVIKAQETIPAKGHNYGATWTWTGDDGSVSAVLTCGACGDAINGLTAEVTSQTTPATATQAGKTVYTATVTHDGKTYSDTHEVTIPATGAPSGTPGVTTYTLTVKYVFEDGSQAADTVRRTLSSGSRYNIASPAFKGYTPSEANVTGTLRASVTVTVTYIKDQDVQDPDTPLAGTSVTEIFADVENTWYTDAVAYVYGKGLMSGTSESKFSPESTTTRGMMATIIYRMESEPETARTTFSDVLASAWYAPAVSWAQKNGVVLGYGDGTFGPDDQITREQMAAIMFRYAKLKGYDTAARADLSGYADVGEVGGWAREAMSWAVSVGLIQGTSTTTLAPKGSATRAQIALVVMRMDKLFHAGDIV